MSARILVTTDGTEENKVAVEKAIAMALKDGSELTAISVYNTMSKDPAIIGEEFIKSDSVKSYCRRALQYVKDQAEIQGLEIKTIMAQGIPIDVIVSLSGEYDVIICGKTGKKMHKSVSHGIEKSAKCEVKVIS